MPGVQLGGGHESGECHKMGLPDDEICIPCRLWEPEDDLELEQIPDEKG